MQRHSTIALDDKSKERREPKGKEMAHHSHRRMQRVKSHVTSEDLGNVAHTDNRMALSVAGWEELYSSHNDIAKKIILTGQRRPLMTSKASEPEFSGVQKLRKIKRAVEAAASASSA